ncbi:MAG: rod shape-determining protein MreD [Candidatus Marinimicrobia bacterium]|nr:rod shape-determining protein MreD [Candidatus Neomarinimicrobiota bacterium]
MVKNKFSILRFFSIAIILIVIQSGVNRWLVVANTTPDIFLLVLILIAFRTSIIHATLVGFALGLIQDMISGSTVLGLSALVKTICGYVIGTVKMKYPHLTASVLLPMQFCVMFFHFIFYYWLIGRGTTIVFIDVLNQSFIHSLYTGLIFIMIYFGLLKRIRFFHES